jgi:hypothetical protein
LLKLEGRIVLKLSTTETWRQLKDRLKPRGGNKNCPRLKPASKPICLDLSYPEKGRESSRHPHEALLKQCQAVRLAKKVAQAGALSPTSTHN